MKYSLGEHTITGNGNSSWVIMTAKQFTIIVVAIKEFYPLISSNLNCTNRIKFTMWFDTHNYEIVNLMSKVMLTVFQYWIRHNLCVRYIDKIFEFNSKFFLRHTESSTLLLEVLGEIINMKLIQQSEILIARS